MPCELRADMQQFYGLNLDGMGTEYSHSHAACCAAQLPAGARVWRGTSAEWPLDYYLAVAMEHSLRVLAWQQTEDAQHKRNYPKPIDTPAAREQVERQVAASRAHRAFVDGVLGINEEQQRGGD